MSRLRNGKIARLPHTIRELLNVRLFDQESAATILPWLNAIRSVKDILDREFDGAEINSQNLSDWRNGGYNDWLYFTQRSHHIRAITHEADALQDAADGQELIDRAATIVTGALLRMVHDITRAVDGHDPLQQQAIFRAARQIERLQRHSISLRNLQLQREKWQAAQAAASSGPHHSVCGTERPPTPASAQPPANGHPPQSAKESRSIKPNQAFPQVQNGSTNGHASAPSHPSSPTNPTPDENEDAEFLQEQGRKVSQSRNGSSEAPPDSYSLNPFPSTHSDPAPYPNATRSSPVKANQTSAALPP